MVQFEVEIRVKAVGGESDTLRSIRKTWNFQGETTQALDAEATVVQWTAKSLANSIHHELEGTTGAKYLDSDGIIPTQA